MPILANVLNAANNWIQNLLDPVNPQDAATKNYVDVSIANTGLTVSVNVELLSADRFLVATEEQWHFFDNTVGSRIVYLPNATLNPGRIYQVVNKGVRRINLWEVTGTGNVNLNFAIRRNGGYIIAISDGVDWNIIRLI